MTAVHSFLHCSITGLQDKIQNWELQNIKKICQFMLLHKKIKENLSPFMLRRHTEAEV